MNKDQKYCKKCGCELMSTNKKKLCSYCQIERKEKWEKIGIGALGLLAAAGSGAYYINKKRK